MRANSSSLSERLGFGAIGSNLTQIAEDRDPIADLLHGFERRASGEGNVLMLGCTLMLK